MPLTLGELESYLAKATDLLRGSIDQADFKAYIFPLMFFKRISDVYDEEYDVTLTPTTCLRSPTWAVDSRPARGVRGS
ncbi:type I restriction-modification system subunit M N-terminal domain-containing protein [Streptomyces scabiei]|uniref:N6 adenine-specific DNA methyltransferase N-terminal domain-containing protein n=1 Tax=Streptomyces scabiei TaxID=1930 RepID=A0A100JU16_STRSC|nr:type I restriction-modification system subunit M N-terminal domain-containing protein [Streptomyces scabiei]GAQ65681.1 hypothetical protein SsS58_06096 [Streptomyces scabiei]